MLMPSSALLLHYLPRNTFLDKTSKEISTGRVKGKYKLLFKYHNEMGVYVFFVLTTDKDACVKERTFSIYPQDWEHREGTHLDADCSYIDIQKHIVMNRAELVDKASDIKIGFSFVGKVNQKNFQDLSEKVQTYVSSATPKTDFTIRDILKSIVAEDNKASTFVNKFKI